MKAVRVHVTGGPEKLLLEQVERPKPSGSEVLVRIQAAGVNFIDTYQRSGLYPIKPPFTPGMEGAGVVEETGPDARMFAKGDRVAYAMSPGSYAEYAVVSERNLVKVPKALDSRSAAAAMLQGMTAHYLCHSTFPIEPGHKALIHAGAGGVGLLLIQMTKRLGGMVIATVGTPAKAELARNAGADETVLYTEVDFKEEARRLTGGEGVDVVYDSVGKTTAEKSLLCLKRRGWLVLFGNASGPAPAIDPLALARNGSLVMTRPMLGDYIASREELNWRAGDVLRWIENGLLKLRMEHVFPLSAAAEAHRQLEGRKTTGKVLLTPDQ